MESRCLGQPWSQESEEKWWEIHNATSQPEAKKELFHPYQYRLGVEGQGREDTERALPSSGNVPGTVAER